MLRKNLFKRVLALFLILAMLAPSTNVFAATTYKIYYYGNGGTNVPATQTKTHGKALTLSTKTPTQTGHTFQGWSTSSTATSATYKAGGSYTANKAASLYAVWKKNTYKISYNANSGTGAPTAQTKTYNTTLYLSGVNPTRNGYIFLGWSTNAKATGATYSPGGKFLTNATTTLYAIWRKAKTYTIKYDATGGTGAPAPQTKIEGTKLILQKTIPKLSGYIFTGWSTNKNASSANYSAGGNYLANATATLYAIWIRVSKGHRPLI